MFVIFKFFYSFNNLKMSMYTEKKRFCEKDTDHIIKSEFEKVFGFLYHTSGVNIF